MAVPEETWLLIKRDCCDGKSYAEASAFYGVPQVTIRSRASRQKWPTPLKAQRMLQQEQRDATKGELATLVNDLREKAQEASQHVGSLLHRKLMALQSVPEMASHRDIATSLALLRKAGGLDEAKADKPTVTINLGALYSPGSEGKGARVLTSAMARPNPIRQLTAQRRLTGTGE